MGSSFFTLCIILILLAHCVSCSDDCLKTAASEVEALRKIAKDLGKKDWNFNEDPCSNQTAHTSWFSGSDLAKPTYVNQVSCRCIHGKWRLSNISIKGQGLDGVLPKDLAKLHYLKTIDLSRNLLNGTIPKEWASMKLEYLSLMVNRLSGDIPKYLGNITTLKYISIESNSFTGTVPAELGKLASLQNLALSDNYLTGQLPVQLKKMASLTELRLSSNNFYREIPDYFQSWRQLQKLELQGSGFEGPIPPSLSILTSLKELRISDLNGEDFEFPSLNNLTSVTRLMLRSCKLRGPIPHYLGDMAKLKILDLSFNKLNGSIPNELQFLNNLQNMYLSSNMLSGPIPSWITKTSDSRFIDLSYNKFDKSSAPPVCNKENLNLYRSFSGDENLKSSVCLKNLHCRARYSLHINCGGKKTKLGKTTYEQDDEPGGPAKFIPRKAEWGFSTSGEFWYLKGSNNYIPYSSSALKSNGSVLDMDARSSATSLTYYGSCLGKGNYTVSLHFSEIVFAKNSFFSLGRRIFDIFIQGRLVQKDFDIIKEANGTNTVKKVYQQVPVEDTIEIRLYYGGKGSTGIPNRGTYGPIIAAISVESEFKPPPDKKRLAVIFGVALSLFCLSAIVLSTLLWTNHSKRMASREKVLAGLDLQTGIFTFKQIKAATNNFSSSSKIGEGGFGSVYLGTLLDGTNIAVKQHSSKSKQGNREFVNEIGMISCLLHPNLVRLYGCCVEGIQLFLIYEYMENNNLARALFDDGMLKLDWPTRQRICTDIAIGLAFLHEESRIKIVHRDIKATNILLDRDLNAKISDFGLARLDEEDDTHISTRVAGTIGYMAPEYALRGYLTYKADVYSFGVLALEIVAGRSNTKFHPDEDYFCLLDLAFAVQQQKGNLMEIVDPRLGTNYNKEEVLRMIKVALMCTNPSPAVRPTMSEVRKMLQGKMVVQELTLTPSAYVNEWLHQASKGGHDETETQSLIHS